jgi:AraC-like DNA-binding protein
MEEKNLGSLDLSRGKEFADLDTNGRRMKSLHNKMHILGCGHVELEEQFEDSQLSMNAIAALSGNSRKRIARCFSPHSNTEMSEREFLELVKLHGAATLALDRGEITDLSPQSMRFVREQYLGEVHIEMRREAV